MTVLSSLYACFFSADEQEKSPHLKQSLANKIVTVLMQGLKKASFSYSEIFQLFYMTHIRKDELFMSALRDEFKKGLISKYNELSELQETSQSKLDQLEWFISNYLSLMVIAELKKGEQISVPQFINNKWQSILYRVEPIELTPGTGLKKLWIAEQDGVFSYGLVPVHSEDASPWLVFCGTTFNTGQGYVTQLDSDIAPFQTPGENLYASGRERIKSWINNQPKKIRVSGASLGGSLALLVALDQGPKISRVDALNPAGLNNCFRQVNNDHWDKFPDEQKPVVYIQKQAGDWVSRFGSWKSDWQIIKVTTDIEHKVPLSHLAHILNFAGFENTQFERIDTLKDSTKKSREIRNLLLYTGGRLMLNALWKPLYLIVLPALRYSVDNRLNTGMIALGMLLTSQLPTDSLTVKLAMNLWCSTPALLDFACHFIQRHEPIIKNNEVITPLEKDSNRPVLPAGISQPVLQ